MIRELSDFGKVICAEKYGKWNHNALKEEFVSIDIVIDTMGRFHKFELFEKKSTIAEAITAKKGKARLLLDKAEEILGYGGGVSQKKHELFIKKLNEYREINEIKPVVAFYEENRTLGLDKAVEAFDVSITDEKKKTGNLCFRIEGDGVRIHEKDAVLREIIKKYESANTISSKKCSLCGTSNYPVDDIPHGMIKRIPDGQSSGSALVSYNENAFESYDLVGNHNSSICANCAKTYVEGLNWLLSAGNERLVQVKKGKDRKIFKYSNRRNFGSDTAMIYWTRQNQYMPEIDQLEEPHPSDVSRLIESVSLGFEQDSRYIDTDYFYSCTLSGSAARIAVRDWIVTSLSDFRSSIAKWFNDIAIFMNDREVREPKLQYFGLYDLAKSCQNPRDERDVSISRIAVYLWNAAIKGTVPPLWILTKILQRSRLDNFGVTAERAALIRLILNRHNKNKGGAFVIAEKLERGSKPIAYMCGQIFAKLENIQYAALGDRNAGIRERYFSYAMTTPAAAFGRLFNLNSKHFTKLRNEKVGLAINLDKELQELCKEIDIENFPATFTLEEQGQFAIGYYHQKQEQFSSKASK